MKLKVYGWQGYHRECPPASNGSHATRDICAAPSLAALMRTHGFRRCDLFNICETGNDAEVAQALSEPLAIFWKPLDNRGGEWRKVKP